MNLAVVVASTAAVVVVAVAAMNFRLRGSAELVVGQQKQEALRPLEEEIQLALASVDLPYDAARQGLAWAYLGAWAWKLAEAHPRAAFVPYLETRSDGIVQQFVVTGRLDGSREHKTVAFAAWIQVAGVETQALAQGGPVASCEVVPFAAVDAGGAKDNYFVRCAVASVESVSAVALVLQKEAVVFVELSAVAVVSAAVEVTQQVLLHVNLLE